MNDPEYQVDVATLLIRIESKLTGVLADTTPQQLRPLLALAAVIMNMETILRMTAELSSEARLELADLLGKTGKQVEERLRRTAGLSEGPSDG